MLSPISHGLQRVQQRFVSRSAQYLQRSDLPSIYWAGQSLRLKTSKTCAVAFQIGRHALQDRSGHVARCSDFDFCSCDGHAVTRRISSIHAHLQCEHEFVSAQDRLLVQTRERYVRTYPPAYRHYYFPPHYSLYTQVRPAPPETMHLASADAPLKRRSESVSLRYLAVSPRVPDTLNQISSLSGSIATLPFCEATADYRSSR